MSIVETLRARATQAMKAKDSATSTIVRLALGEIQMAEVRGGKALTEDEAAAVVRKLVKSNEETLALATTDDQKKTLTHEIDVLKSVLPATLAPEQLAERLAPVAEPIKAAGNDGQATGVAVKHLKSQGISAPGADVAKAVKILRGAG
jgi:uncharacterized protein YqeY